MKEIIKRATVISALLFSSTFLMSEESIRDNELKVLKSNGVVYIRSHFSMENDLVVRVGRGVKNNQINFVGTYLLGKNGSMDTSGIKGGILIHNNGDDATPWHLNGTYIGANHGASVGVQLTCPGHGLTKEYLGSEWEDEAGKKFYLIRILDENKLLFLGRNKSAGVIWQFESAEKTGSVLKNSSFNRTINYTEKTLAVQIYPSCRIKKQEYLADGKTPLKEGEVVECRWFDIVEEYDIINTGALLADIISHPGQERNFADEHLDAVVNNKITYRFFPNGANVIYYNAKALQEFKLGYMGFIQSSKLYQGKYQTHEYYIPKTVAFTKDNINYNFQGIQDFSFRLPSPLDFNEKVKNISDPENLPERFIQFLGNKDGDKTIREVGYALGYSLIHGITVPSVRARNTSNAITIYTTSKSYPNAINSKMGPLIPAGTEFYCIAYRHYFNPPQAGNATSVYWQQHENDTVVYADYHKSVDKDVIKLPGEFTGKKLEVVEKTPSITVHTSATVPEKGVEVSVVDRYGYAVFKIF